MSIKTFILILFSILLTISCKKSTQENEAYQVLDAVFEHLDNKLLERLEKYPNNKYVIAETKAKLSNPIRINPFFLHLLKSKSPKVLANTYDSKNDFWVIDYIPVLRNYSEKFQIEDLQLIKDSTYYINQIKKAPDSIDLNKITHKRVRHYKTELEEEKHIKQYESWKRQGLDSITLEERRYSMVMFENKGFNISYPIFSKNGKFAIIYIEKSGLGVQLWIFQKESEKWTKVCVGYLGTID